MNNFINKNYIILQLKNALVKVRMDDFNSYLLFALKQTDQKVLEYHQISHHV